MIPFDFLKTEYANPGAMNYAFVPNMTLPAYYVGGRGTAVLNNLNVFPSPQDYIYQAIVTNGLGGLTAGQFVGQPLMENSPS